jgi:DNA invertase Pin-like site-specific DNA recombinase
VKRGTAAGWPEPAAPFPGFQLLIKPTGAICNLDCRQYAPSAKRRSPDAPDGILLWDLKRFARDRLDNAFFKADLRRRGYTVLFLSDNIPQGGIGHIYEAMLEWKAEQDLQDISKDVKRGLSDLVGTRGPDGKYLGLCPGKPPTGFKGEPYTLGIKRDGTPRIVQRWVPDPKTWDLCRQAWELRVSGASYREIHERTGILGSIGSYATFFRNRIYTGTRVYSGEEYEEFVPRLIPDEWFERGQPKRRQRFQHTLRHHSSDYLLSGLLHCGHCGGAMGSIPFPLEQTRAMAINAGAIDGMCVYAGNRVAIVMVRCTTSPPTLWKEQCWTSW